MQAALDLSRFHIFCIPYVFVILCQCQSRGFMRFCLPVSQVKALPGRSEAQDAASGNLRPLRTTKSHQERNVDLQVFTAPIQSALLSLNHYRTRASVLSDSTARPTAAKSADAGRYS